MLFIKRILILDLHETIGHFHWCWCLEWKKIISKRKISNSSFMSALIMRMCIIIYYSTTKRFEYNLIMEEKSNSFFSFSPHLSSIIQKQIFLKNAYLVIMRYCWDFIIFQNSFKVKKTIMFCTITLKYLLCSWKCWNKI